MPPPSRQATAGRHVFISHSSEDAAVADKVRRALESDGLATWICSRDIKPGQTWAGAISDGLERSGALVLLFTAHANHSDHVLREVDLAVKQKVPILPVRLDNTPLSRDIEYYINVAHWVSAADGEVDPHLDTITNGCRNLLVSKAPAPSISQCSTLSSYYSADVAEFLAASPTQVLGSMASQGQFALELTQRNAWETQIPFLQQTLRGLVGRIHLEFDVPRIGSRIDAVFVTPSVIFPIEFKVGAGRHLRSHLNQAWDYGLDLKNFHKASHAIPIVPILVATEAHESDQGLTQAHSDGVHPPVSANPASLRKILDLALSKYRDPIVEVEVWDRAPYQPTPTIIEAAQSLYSRHSVDAIARHDAGARNLSVTSNRVEELIEEAAREKKKLIIFVTGVPGAGKTLVGLNVATQKRDSSSTHAVFLSGNGPLVEVLREALTRDEIERLAHAANKPRKGTVKQKVKAFIQNVHHFRDDGLRDLEAPPADRVVIFDEAQRAWDKTTTANFMARKKKRPGFSQSEPEFLISCMDRHRDWSVIICLVGGGQEINRGEAGISAWLDAVREGFPDWHVYVSPDLTDSEYAAGHALERLNGAAHIQKDSALHLSVSMRSFRAENVSKFVKAVLDCEQSEASRILQEMQSRYPIVVTRNLTAAKAWLRSRARGSERFGIIASSSAQRLKPHAIDIRVDVNPIHWFLNDASDTRSSFYMEDVATEFQVQGLELDWACVTWDADLRHVGDGWNYHSFCGSRWQNVHKLDARQYLMNAYRVLLTRARQGMAIFVPPGDEQDPTRSPGYYDATYGYLRDIGITEL
jgi:hypothetical protein